MPLPRVLHRPLGQWALISWFAGAGLFCGAFFVGSIWGATGPGGDTERSWAPLTFPVYSSVVSAPLVIIALLLAIYTLLNRGRSKAGIAALVLGLLTIVPATLILIGVFDIFSDQFSRGY